MSVSTATGWLRRVALATTAVVLLTACSSDGEVVVTSYNFPESEILGEIYAQALEDAGIDVERSFNLGTRELLYPELRAGRVDLFAEYVGSALIGGFDVEAPTDLDAAVTRLRELMDDDDVVVLDPAPGENNQAFVVTSADASTNGWATLSDLAAAGDVVFAGPPECEERMTCLQGLRAVYGLDNLQFTSIQEASARLAALDSGAVDMILLFSTDAPLANPAYQVLEDDRGLLPPENLVPVVTQQALDRHGDIADVLRRVTARITTEALQQMNARASEGAAPAAIAREFLDAG